MPITVGLYAKWGSGKSFLLSKLRGIIFAYLCIADPFSHLIHVYSRGNEGIRPSMDRAPIAVFRDSLYRDFACRNTFGRHFGCFARFMDCWSGDWCRQFFSHYDIPVHSVLGDRKVDHFFLQNCSTISISDLQCIDSIGTGRTTLAWLWLEN